VAFLLVRWLLSGYLGEQILNYWRGHYLSHGSLPGSGFAGDLLNDHPKE
jgi:hypothetical protein